MILSGIDDCLTYKYPQLIESKQFFHVMVLSTCFVVSFAQAEPNSLHGRINNRAVLVRLEMQNSFLWANKKPPAIGLGGLANCRIQSQNEILNSMHSMNSRDLNKG